MSFSKTWGLSHFSAISASKEIASLFLSLCRRWNSKFSGRHSSHCKTASCRKDTGSLLFPLGKVTSLTKGHLNCQAKLGWTTCEKWYCRVFLPEEYYYLSWHHVSNRLYLLGSVKRWDFFLSLHVLADCLWCTSHSGVKMLSFSTVFLKRNRFGGLQNILVIFLQHSQDGYLPSVSSHGMLCLFICVFIFLFM